MNCIKSLQVLSVLVFNVLTVHASFQESGFKSPRSMLDKKRAEQGMALEARKCCIDGLCLACKIKSSPSEYTGCWFCRMPCKKLSDMTVECQNKCLPTMREKLIKELTVHENDEEDVRIAVYTGFAALRKTEIRKYIPSFTQHTIMLQVKKQVHDFFQKANRSEDDRCIMYAGAFRTTHVWKSDLVIAQEDKEDVVADWDVAAEKVKNIVIKYNILGPETSEQLLKSLPDNALMYKEGRV